MEEVFRLDSAPNPLVSEQRTRPRSAITLPVTIVLGGKRYSAALRNLSSSGAMIVTSAPLTTLSRIEFQCGTICSRGIVLWRRQSDFGVKFRQPICERQLCEQITRFAAVVSRRALGPKLSIVKLA